MGMQNIPFILSHVIKGISNSDKEEFVKFVYETYKTNRNFPIIEFLNSHLDYFDNRDNYVNYNDKIVSIFTKEKLVLRAQNIKNIFEIKLPEDDYSYTKELDLSNNLIRIVKGIENFSNLEKLNLNNSKIHSLEGFDKLINLKVLSLRNNDIVNLKGLSNIKNLKKIDVSGNIQITEIPDFVSELSSLESIVMSNCDIKKFSKNTSEFFWNDQNYRYYSNFSHDDINYYESHHVNKAGSNGQLYKAFVQWLFKIRSLMIEYNLNYQDLNQFEALTNKKSIWNWKPTSDFLKWLFEKPQTKLSDFW